MRPGALLAAGTALWLLSACDKKEAAPPPAAPAPIRRADPHERLEELVMIQQEGGGGFQLRDIHVEPLQAGSLQIFVRGFATGHTVEARKLSITSEALFVRVSVLLVYPQAAGAPAAGGAPDVAANGPKPLAVDLRGARLLSGGMAYPVARHAQLAEPRSMQVRMTAGDNQERTLYFELPESEVSTGLTLVLPAGAIGPTELKMGLL